MSDAKTYTGGCHCGKVRYEATLSLDKVVSCNCSICSKRATLLGFTPIEQFKLLSGADALTDYQFNTKSIHHQPGPKAFAFSCIHGESVSSKYGRRARAWWAGVFISTTFDRSSHPA